MKQSANERLIVMLQQKTISWEDVATLMSASMKKDATDFPATSTCRQALERACLDLSIEKCPPAMTRLLDYLLSEYSEVGESEAKLLLSAVRCQNGTASRLLIQHNASVLHWQDIRSNTVLHLACESFGWTDEIAHILKATREHATGDASKHRGMFQCNQKGKSPLRLALEGDAKMADIIDCLRAEDTEYFETHLVDLPEYIAEYCDCNDMTILKELIDAYPRPMLQASDAKKSTPLHHACYYQNKDMIQLLLQEYSGRERQRKLSSRLLSTNNTEGVPPLGSLILGLGGMDAGNVLQCLHVCRRFVRKLPVLHYAIDKLWERLRAERMCFRTISRIVEDLRIDLSSVDHGKTAIMLVIHKIANMGNPNKEKGNADDEDEKVLEYILSRCETAGTQRDSKKRLPLHIACESGMQWQQGLDRLVQANMFALEEPHPKSKLLPFLLSAAAAGTTTNASSNAMILNTIYQLLRHSPGVLR